MSEERLKVSKLLKPHRSKARNDRDTQASEMMRASLSEVQGGHPLVRIEGSAGVKTTPRHWLARPSRLWTQQPELDLIGAPQRVPARSASALLHLSRHRIIGAHTDGG